MQIELYENQNYKNDRVIFVTLQKGEIHEWGKKHFRSCGPSHVKIMENPEIGTLWFEWDTSDEWLQNEIEKIKRKGWEKQDSVTFYKNNKTAEAYPISANKLIKDFGLFQRRRMNYEWPWLRLANAFIMELGAYDHADWPKIERILEQAKP